MAHNETKRRNLLALALLAGITFFSAFHEGYLTLISPLFWLALAASLGVAVWLALHASTKRFVALILTIFIIEYVKETIGIRSGTWVYHGKSGFYNFGVWAWVLGGLSAYALAVGLLIPHMRRALVAAPAWVNPLVVMLLTALIPLTLGDYWRGVEGIFFAFYGILALACICLSARIDLHVLAGIVVASWVIGNPSEYLGGVASSTWSFPHNPHYPPVFLLFGCWPLEILAQYGLSAYLANEPLDDRGRRTHGGEP